MLRRKIEYVPLVRVMTSHGGRELGPIESEFHQQTARRPARTIEEYGAVDIDWLTMSLRSGLRIEVSHALGVVFHLAWLRAGNGTNTGLPMAQCDDLADVLLDLLEETAFGTVPDAEEPDDAHLNEKIVTNRQLARYVQEAEDGLFAGLESDKQRKLMGPETPPWEIIYTITIIFSNLSSVPENLGFFANFPRLLDVMLRVAMLAPTQPVTPDTAPRPASKVLKLHHLLRIRKQVTNMVSLIGYEYDLSRNPPRTARRLYSLLAAILMDPEECHSPATHPQHPSFLQTLPPRQPSVIIDLALDAFSRVTHPDVNRTALGRNVPPEAVWALTQHLARLLPVTDSDISVIQNEIWLSFITKVAQCIYSLVVLAPTSIRRKMKSSPSLRTSLTRFLRACTREGGGGASAAMYRNMAPAVRECVDFYWRRIVEILRVIDEEEDPLASMFDPDGHAGGAGSGGAVGFGIGGSYGEHNSKPPARGTGVLGGIRNDFLWGAMYQAAMTDATIFDDWENLVRVDSATATQTLRA